MSYGRIQEVEKMDRRDVPHSETAVPAEADADDELWDGMIAELSKGTGPISASLGPIARQALEIRKERIETEREETRRAVQEREAKKAQDREARRAVSFKDL